MSSYSSESDSSDSLPEHWVGVEFDLNALQDIICQVFRISIDECGPPVTIGLEQFLTYARVYSFQLPTRKIVACLLAPVKPLFKTRERLRRWILSGVYHWNFLSSCSVANSAAGYTSLPVPKVFAYSSESKNPVGVEWILMEHVTGQELSQVWPQLDYHQKERLARDIVDIYDQLSRLRGPGVGGIYHNVDAMGDYNLSRSPRWTPLSAESLNKLRAYCKFSIKDGYRLGPLQDVSLINYLEKAPSPSQTLPVFTSEDYVGLVSYHGNPPTRPRLDIPTRGKCIELFKSIFSLYAHSDVLGHSSDARSFCFSHGDLHAKNIFVDPQTGAITGLIDWECAAFRPLWSQVFGLGWFDEDPERIVFADNDPGNFEKDTPRDASLRAYFRRAMYDRNPRLFSAFSSFELRAVLHAAGDVPPPVGHSDIFLSEYHDRGYWNEARRGPFPWDMDQWERERWTLDMIAEGKMEHAHLHESCRYLLKLYSDQNQGPVA